MGEEDPKDLGMSPETHTLDSILAELGDFGRYQQKNFYLILFAVLFSTVELSYIFTTRNLNYRCSVEQCESQPPVFNPVWLTNAIPVKNGIPAKCERYVQVINRTVPNEASCSSDMFDRSYTQHCHSFVYETADTTIVNDFGIHCNENLWKLTIVGTVNNLGHFFCLPFAGFVSDRYGRRTLLVGGAVFSAVCGLIRSFAPSYLWFIILEFLDTAVGSATYSCAFILGMELVGPSKRVMSGTVMSCVFAIGETIMGLLGWWTKSWRLHLRVMYTPGLLLITYLWLTPESVRWLLSKGNTVEAVAVLRKVAATNRRTIPPEALASLSAGDESGGKQKHSPMTVLKYPAMMIRVINCSVCWMTVTFLFYGLSLNSVALAGNAYVNFMFSSLIEIPAFVVTYGMMDKLGRRLSQFIAFLLTGCACFAFLFIPEGSVVLRLVFYLLGKFGATIAFTVLYMYTSELFPTPLRHSLLAVCSMLGRFGSMVAPQAPLLAQLWSQLPIISFAIMATVASILSLTFPETLNTKLPDTIEEALMIGGSRKAENIEVKPKR